MDAKKSFHITITDNETGEVFHDVDSDCIIGAVHGDEHTAGIALLKCGPTEAADTVVAVKSTIKEAKEVHPEIELFEMLHNYAKTQSEATEEN